MTRWTAIQIIALVVYSAITSRCQSESAIPLLSGFDNERIEAVYPPSDDEAAGELAKLVYRLRSVDATALGSKEGEVDDALLGDVVAIDGKIQEIQLLNVPARLVDVLELARLYVVTVTADDWTVRVICPTMPPDASQGDRVSGTGVVIEVGSALDDKNLTRPIAIASARLRWFPQSAENVGWQLLSESGVDVSLLAEVGSRNRRPLLAEDGNAFYAMLAAAASLKDRDNLASPAWVEPVTLLRDPDKMSGQWVRMDLETVQITRIAVTEPARQSQLGSDHYYQIDAVGDLGNTIVKIEPAKGEQGPAAIFEGRYPVSLVSRELPEFLRRAIRNQEGGDAVVSQIKWMVAVDGFFYRLWSYQTDFMNQHGDGEQFGPLLIASRLSSREPDSSDPVGVSIIGWIAAGLVISAIIATWFWNRRISMRDAEIRERRKSRESEQLQLP